MLYTVWYKKPGGTFWHKIKDVEGDTIITTGRGIPVPVRAFFLVNKIRIEIPMSCIVKFSRERFYDLEAIREKEAAREKDKQGEEK